MTITTKYDVGDKVWVLADNKVWEREIAGIVINKGTMYNAKEGKFIIYTILGVVTAIPIFFKPKKNYLNHYNNE